MREGREPFQRFAPGQPESHQTRTGHQWYFGMQAHLGADRDRKLVPAVVVTAANVALARKLGWQIARKTLRTALPSPAQSRSIPA